jgi:phage-related protein
MLAMKEVIWLGSSKAYWDAFPVPIRRIARFQLHLVQWGMEPSDWKPMTTVGPGVRELRVHDETGAFRAIYLATRPEGVYVLHAFQKKTPATSLQDIRKAQERFKTIPR